ncbi:MAG: hypothetical protein QOJ77_1338 [Microbacteriaceae bacterium]|jgi:uncharacterized protein YndB with AHSA1/START domain|nr:hypothetical protein [Microbacteriaceae bacterium]
MTGTTETIELTFTRLLPAKPDEVFDAYTDAKKQTIWFGLLSTEPGIVEIEVDLRVGGVQTSVWGPNRDELFHETQVFTVIDRPHHLVTTATGRDPGGQEMETTVDVTFEEQDGGTLVTVVQSGFPSVELRDFFRSYAWVGAFDRIEAYLTRSVDGE